MPVSLALCSEQVETLSEKLVLNVTWEPRRGWRGGHGEAISHLARAVTSPQACETRLSVEAPMPLTHFIFRCLPVQKKRKKKKIERIKGRGGVGKRRGKNC